MARSGACGPCTQRPWPIRRSWDWPIGTRPDCVSDEVLDLLQGLAGRTWLGVEYGLQTIHDRTLRWLGRGHCYQDFLDAVQRSRSRGFEIGAHVILGLPGESRLDMQATAVELARLGIDSVKLHNLYVVRGTRLADEVAAGRVQLPEMAEHVAAVADFLEPAAAGVRGRPPQRRRSGRVSPGPAVVPAQGGRPRGGRSRIDRRGTWQGSGAGSPLSPGATICDGARG